MLLALQQNMTSIAEWNNIMRAGRYYQSFCRKRNSSAAAAALRPQSPNTADAAADVRASRRAVLAWCLFDWANSPYPAVIVSFVFGTYFTRSVAETPEYGQSLWAFVMAASGVVMALLAPLVGSIADKAGPRKPWLGAFSLLAIACGGLLWFVLPDPSYVVMALLLAAVGNVAYELGQMFYNSMLPDLAHPSRVGLVSGLGWAMGYAGALTCIVLATVVFVWREPPLLGLDTAMGEDARIFGPVVALWYALFALPLFIFAPDVAARGSGPVVAVREGLATLRQTIMEVRKHRGIFVFLLARMFYMNGLIALFAIGGIYAVGIHGLSFDAVMALAVMLNVSAGCGAVVFGWVDDRIGPRATIMMSVGAVILLGVVVIVAKSVILFFAAATLAGLFAGPIQSASRSMMVRLSPPDQRVEMFGLFALSGRLTAFAGPAVIGWVTLVTESQRLGLTALLPFFVIGLALMIWAPAARRGA